MKMLIEFVAALLYVTLFLGRKVKAFKDFVVTPSYKVWLGHSGQVTLAKCKKSGKFVKRSAAQAELNDYIFGY